MVDAEHAPTTAFGYADRPLVSPAGDLGGEAPGAERGDDEAAARVGGIGLGMAGRTQRHQPVEIEVLGALDDVVRAPPRPNLNRRAG